MECYCLRRLFACLGCTAGAVVPPPRQQLKLFACGAVVQWISSNSLTGPEFPRLYHAADRSCEMLHTNVEQSFGQ